MKDCICCSNKPYQNCCGRFLEAGKQAKTPEQLMRSRYSAYALGGFGQYLLDTWFPATAAGLSAAELSIRNCQWQKLEVLKKSQQGDNATVEFKAYFQKDTGGKEEIMHERSTFKRNANSGSGRWYYVGGEVN
jgi:SEC-C motif-containing protein